MRISINEPEAGEPARYAPGRVHPFAMGVAIALHVALIAAAVTWKYTVAEREREPQLAVYDVDLTPPPPPPETDAKPLPPPPAVQAPNPPVVLHLPQQPVFVVTPDPPPEPPAAPSPPQAPAPAPPQPVSAGDLSSSMIHAPSPRYPTESRRKREQGTVLLAVVLGPDGNVADIRIARSSGHSRLDEAALRAVRRWRWSPTIRNGEAVQVRGTVPVDFLISD